MICRRLGEDCSGPISVDDRGFPYEFHPLEGDHGRSGLSNPKLVSTREHLDIHLRQKDWFAAALTAIRISLGSDYSSNLQRGRGRPGVGRRKKGSVLWNKGLADCFSPDTIEAFQKTRAGNRYGKVKATDEECRQILKIFDAHPNVSEVGKKSANGELKTHERLFSEKVRAQYCVAGAVLYNIVTGKRNVLC